jgi:hypothetical protein
VRECACVCVRVLVHEVFSHSYVHMFTHTHVYTHTHTHSYGTPKTESVISLCVIAMGAFCYVLSDSEFAMRGLEVYYWCVAVCSV